MIILIIGISGKMGNRVYEYYKDKYEVIGIDTKPHKLAKTYKDIDEVDDFDVVIDFSSTTAYPQLVKAINRNKIVISGTTGYEMGTISELKDMGKNNFYWSCNYASGIPIVLDIITKTKPKYEGFDCVEIHASTKKDSPSGTAKLIADLVGVPYSKIQSIRLPYSPAVHEIIFTSNNERITLKHEVINYQAFLEGLDNKLIEICHGNQN